MTTLEALDLPASHMRVAFGPCDKCSKQRPFGIPADHPLIEGESSMNITEFLETILCHCEECVFGLAPAEIEARRAARSVGRAN